MKHKLTPESKTKWIAILSLSFAAAYFMFFFAPFDLYLHNPSDFIVSWRFLLPQFVALTLITFVGIAAVLLLTWRRKKWLGLGLLACVGLALSYVRFMRFQLMDLYPFLMAGLIAVMLLWFLLVHLLKEKAGDVVLLLLWGVVLAAYVQVLFLNGRMAQLTGDSVAYGARTFANMLNLLIWGLIALAPLALWLIFRRREKGFRYEKALILTAILMFGMQTAGLVSVALAAKLPEGYEEDAKYFAYAPIMEVGERDNIAVFLLDRLDTTYLDEVLEASPELFEQLDGFTYYANNIAEFTNTFPALTTMLTQHRYEDGQTFSEYWEQAWSQRTVIDDLIGDGYRVNLLLDRVSTYGSFSQLEGRADNIFQNKARVNVKGMPKATGYLSFGRLMPYLAKNVFLNRLSSAFGSELFSVNANDGQSAGISAGGDLRFYGHIKSHDMTVRAGEKTFSFIHLYGPHTDLDKTVTTKGYHYNPIKDTIESGGNYIASTRACFEILSLYFEQLKEQGVYDNTTIIILGDHSKEFRLKDANPALKAGLLIKPQGARGRLAVDAQSEMSNGYFAASILQAAGLPHERLGLSYFDIIAGAPPLPRRFYAYSDWWDARVKAETIELRKSYEVSGEAGDPSNWILVYSKP